LRLTLSIGSSNYEKDEIVYQGPTLGTSYFRGRVVAWDSGNNILKLTNTVGTPESDVITGANSAAARFVESVTEKDLRDYSGNLLYVDNILPLQRADDQTDDFKIVFRF
jgi:beta-lactam-binding protein with PASTA domain